MAIVQPAQHISRGTPGRDPACVPHHLSGALTCGEAVVASRQRMYQSRVADIVRGYERTTADWSSTGLVGYRPDDRQIGLRSGEADVTVAVAEGLRQYGMEHGLPDDEAATPAR
jgi:hypothetical protein